MTTAGWDARIRRAEELSGKFEFAREFLHFYAEIARFQRDFSNDLTAKRAAHAANAALRGPLDCSLLLPKFPEFLAVVERKAPAPLAAFARELREAGRGEWEGLLAAYWEKGGRFEPVLEEAATFCARAFLQPYAELLAKAPLLPSALTRAACPRCEAMPQLGVLRPEGDGARRSLLCSFCSTEWDYRRIVCPSCGEEDEKKLGFYAAQEFDYIRIEACDSCMTCIETVDLTKNGHAVPIVDELAAIPLSLWASQQGYRKLQPNLLGT
jgi:FdhE protein